jgi:hypothetical protein
MVVAAQGQAIGKNYFKRRFLTEEMESKWQLCKEYVETTDHLTSGWPFMEKISIE